MDRDQRELQNLGFCGILKQSFNLVFSWRKIYSRIALALVLPLSVLFLVDYQISQAIYPKFRSNRGNFTGAGLAGFWIFTIAYFTVLLILSLLSTAAIVFTVAAAFAAKQVTFKTAMRAIPKVLKRLVVTFLICYAIVFVYNLVAFGIFALWIAFLSPAPPAGVEVAIFSVLIILYLAGIVYLAAVWHLAYVVSVLEDSYGLGALKKSKSLIKGKTWVSVFLVLLIGLCFAAVDFMFASLVSFAIVDHLAVRILIGIVSVVLLVAVILVGIVIGTVLYFVCKSHHREDIDKSLLSDRLEVYVNQYIVLGQPNVQMSTEARV